MRVKFIFFHKFVWEHFFFFKKNRKRRGTRLFGKALFVNLHTVIKNAIRMKVIMTMAISGWRGGSTSYRTRVAVVNCTAEVIPTVAVHEVRSGDDDVTFSLHT